MGTGSSGSAAKASPRARRRVRVLRVGHRPGRDPRLTTHVALVARAFGAERMYLHPPDPSLADRLRHVADEWGGSFEVVDAPEWRSVVRSAPGAVVHLTMYGLPLDRALPRIRRSRDVLLVVGGAKVPSELYRAADLNVAVGHQPHSEVAALAVVLDRLVGAPGPAAWAGARRRVVPRARGKKVVVRSGRR